MKKYLQTSYAKPLVCLLLLTLPLVACNKKPQVNCGGKAEVAVIKNMLIANARDQTISLLGGQRSSSVRASMDNINIELGSFRTDKQDPGSSKVFCIAQVSYRVKPEHVLPLEQSLKRMGNDNTLDTLAMGHGFERNANVFSKVDFKYSLQPTDDGTMVFGETDDQSVVGMLANITAIDVAREQSILGSGVDAKTELDRLEAEKERIRQLGLEISQEKTRLEQAQLEQQNIRARSLQQPQATHQTPQVAPQTYQAPITARPPHQAPPTHALGGEEIDGLGEAWVKPTGDGYLTLRTHPSTSAQEIKKIPSGGRVIIINCPDQIAPWCVVDHNGDRGFVHSGYLVVEGD